jgi:hypothetical protein
MVSVYFDSQIFRYLKNSDRLPEAQKILYKKLSDYILKNKDHLLFFYSHAHLLDLKNDTTDKKYGDLEFMQEIVNDNFLILFAKEGNARYLLVNPAESFKEYIEEDDFSLSDVNLSEMFQLEQYKEYLTKEKYQELQKNVAILNSITAKDLMPSMENIPKEQYGALFKLLPLDNPSLSFVGLLQKFLEFGDNFQKDNSVYKGLRSLVTENKEVKFSINLSTFDFSMNYKDTQMQKKFIDFITEQLGKKEYNQFDLHYQGYFSLDILGVEKEPTKKLKTSNLLNDAHHSYYGAYCDLFVSDDLQLREKSKIIYKLFGINTRVLSVDEFISEVFFFGLQIDYRESTFWDKIISVLNHGFIKKVLNPYPDREVTIYNSTQFFLSYFNEMRHIKEQEKSYIVLRHEVANYHSSTADYKIIEGVTNKAIDLFGIDDSLAGHFNYQKEVEQIAGDNWQGRNWRRKDMEIILEINESLRKLNLVICLS